MTTLPLPSTQSGAATPVNTGVVAMTRGIRNPDTLFTHESRVNFAVSPTPVPILTFVPLS